jgi:hypothetical protein
VFTGAAKRWWRARTLAELATTLDQAGTAEQAREHRREALALCGELDTIEARALAAELSAVWPAK